MICSLFLRAISTKQPNSLPGLGLGLFGVICGYVMLFIVFMDYKKSEYLLVLSVREGVKQNVIGIRVRVI